MKYVFEYAWCMWVGIGLGIVFKISFLDDPIRFLGFLLPLVILIGLRDYYGDKK